MPVKNKIRLLVSEKNITPYRFWKDVGCSRDVAYKLVNDSSYIPRETVLEAICRAYSVQPGELLEYIPDSLEPVIAAIEEPPTCKRKKGGDE